LEKRFQSLFFSAKRYFVILVDFLCDSFGIMIKRQLFNASSLLVGNDDNHHDPLLNLFQDNHREAVVLQNIRDHVHRFDDLSKHIVSVAPLAFRQRHVAGVLVAHNEVRCLDGQKHQAEYDVTLNPSDNVQMKNTICIIKLRRFVRLHDSFQLLPGQLQKAN
jgi:hypothetical protein